MANDQRPTTNDKLHAQTGHLPAPEPFGAARRALRSTAGSTSELRSAILEGRIAPGARLPATRDLAREYKLSRATVVTAFEQLQVRGLCGGRVGAGTYVSQVLPDDLLQVGRTSAARAAGPRRVRWSSYAQRLKDYPRRRATHHAGLSRQPGCARCFSHHALGPGRRPAPAAGFRPIVGRRRGPGIPSAAPGGRRISERVARGEVFRRPGADHFRRAGGAGARGASAARSRRPGMGGRTWLSRSGHRLPGGGRESLPGAGRCRRPGPGMGPATLGIRAKLVYVTPAHQFPLGVTMSLRRRLALLEWARRSHTLIFEDDYDSEYRYAGPTDPGAAGTRSRGRRHLCRHLQ